MSDETITYLILGVTVAVFVWDKIPVAVVAIGVALSLWATGVLGWLGLNLTLRAGAGSVDGSAGRPRLTRECGA